MRRDVFQWGPLMAGALLASIPVAVVYTFFLDRFIAGFTMGAVKQLKVFLLTKSLPLPYTVD